MKAYAVILCGGSGSRMGKKENKTLLKIGGVPSAVRCARAFAPAVAGTVLVARAGDEKLFRDALAAYGVPALAVVPAGRTGNPPRWPGCGPCLRTRTSP